MAAREEAAAKFGCFPIAALFSVQLPVRLWRAHHLHGCHDGRLRSSLAVIAMDQLIIPPDHRARSLFLSELPQQQQQQQ